MSTIELIDALHKAAEQTDNIAMKMLLTWAAERLDELIQEEA